MRVFGCASQATRSNTPSKNLPTDLYHACLEFAPHPCWEPQLPSQVTLKCFCVMTGMFQLKFSPILILRACKIQTVACQKD